MITMDNLVTALEKECAESYDKNGAFVIDQPVLRRLLSELKRLQESITELRQERGWQRKEIITPLQVRCADQEAELKRLRGIERVLLSDCGRFGTTLRLRGVARRVLLRDGNWLRGIADELLEAK